DACVEDPKEGNVEAFKNILKDIGLTSWPVASKTLKNISEAFKCIGELLFKFRLNTFFDVNRIKCLTCNQTTVKVSPNRQTVLRRFKKYFKSDALYEEVITNVTQMFLFGSKANMEHFSAPY